MEKRRELPFDRPWHFVFVPLVLLVHFMGRKERSALSQRMWAALRQENWEDLERAASDAMVVAIQQGQHRFLVKALTYLETAEIGRAVEQYPNHPGVREIARANRQLRIVVGART